MGQVEEIFKVAKEKGLKKLKLVIEDSDTGTLYWTLYVNDKERFIDVSVSVLEKHKNLSWMN